jgi:hypothetical protein
MKVLKSILSAMHSLQFQPDQAVISTNKERSHMYYLHTPPLERERETEKLRLSENQNSFLPSAAYHPTTERDLQRTCAKVSLSDLQAGTAAAEAVGARRSPPLQEE